uniref:Putative secreted protein n=1 Tax=Ixodes ricinus TaxID=34613 RepID=A0A6B0UJE0_IXORI
MSSADGAICRLTEGLLLLAPLLPTASALPPPVHTALRICWQASESSGIGSSFSRLKMMRAILAGWGTEGGRLGRSPALLSRFQGALLVLVDAMLASEDCGLKTDKSRYGA